MGLEGWVAEVEKPLGQSGEVNVTCRKLMISSWIMEKRPVRLRRAENNSIRSGSSRAHLQVPTYPFRCKLPQISLKWSSPIRLHQKLGKTQPAGAKPVLDTDPPVRKGNPVHFTDLAGLQASHPPVDLLWDYIEANMACYDDINCLKTSVFSCDLIQSYHKWAA